MKNNASGGPESAPEAGFWGNERLLLQAPQFMKVRYANRPASRSAAGETAMRAGTRRQISAIERTFRQKLSNRKLTTAQQRPKLCDHLERRLRHLVKSSKDFGISLVPLLGHDQIREFSREVHVRFLYRASRNGPIATRARLSNHGCP